MTDDIAGEQYEDVIPDALQYITLRFLNNLTCLQVQVASQSGPGSITGVTDNEYDAGTIDLQYVLVCPVWQHLGKLFE